MKRIDKKDKPVLKSIGSIVLAVIASSHHWLHTLLIAMGLSSLGAGLISLSPSIKVIFLFFSLAISILFLRVSKKKWHRDRGAAWVYLISSIISIILVTTALPQTIADFDQAPQEQQQQNHDEHNSH
jgi:hypothetical protein